MVLPTVDRVGANSAALSNIYPPTQYQAPHEWPKTMNDGSLLQVSLSSPLLQSLCEEEGAI